MSDAKTFKCPSCGSALEPDGDEKEVKCAYCGSTVIVPKDLRDDDETDEDDAEHDIGTPRHVRWLIQNGIDATVKVDGIMPNGSDVQINLSGKKADGGKFEGYVLYTPPPPFAAPQPGTMIKIKYNPKRVNVQLDFAIQIDGQFYFHDLLL